MKRIAMTLMVLLVALTAMAGDSLEGANGWDWIQWSEDTKFGYVYGFLSAHSAMWMQFMYEMYPDEDPTPEEAELLEEIFLYRLTVGELMDRVDALYDDYEARDVVVLDAMLIVAGKAYWSRSGEAKAW